MFTKEQLEKNAEQPKIKIIRIPSLLCCDGPTNARQERDFMVNFRKHYFLCGR